MTNKTGVATAVFDNRTYQGTPSKFPSWKVIIGNEEFVAYTNNDIGVKQGDNVSFDYETDPTIDVTITATDLGGLSYDQTFYLLNIQQ